jgi:AcrR family transcriptional regulator
MFEKSNLDARIKHTISWTYEAMIQLLKNHKYGDITVSDVINKAGISRATFYRHFKSKEDVVRMIVELFFTSFSDDIETYYQQNKEEDEIFLINHFFTKIGHESQLIYLVIEANLEGVMIDGIRNVINAQKKQFYELVPSNKSTEEYTIDLVALSAWGLIARWMKNGRKESTRDLSKIYIASFEQIYIALFKGKDFLRGAKL